MAQKISLRLGRVFSGFMGMSAPGRKRTLISRFYQQFERPLSGQADIQGLAVPEVLRNDGFGPKSGHSHIRRCARIVRVSPDGL